MTSEDDAVRAIDLALKYCLTLRAVQVCSEADLLDIDLMGPLRIDALKEVLEVQGLTLRAESQPYTERIVDLFGFVQNAPIGVIAPLINFEFERLETLGSLGITTLGELGLLARSVLDELLSPQFTQRLQGHKLL